MGANMTFRPDMRIELNPSDSFMDGRAGGTYGGGEFTMHTVITSGNRAFAEVTYSNYDKESLDGGRYLYELGGFDSGPFKALKLHKERVAAIMDNHINGLKETGLQENRLVRLEDEEPIEKRIAQILDQEPAAGIADNKPSIDKPSFGSDGGVSVGLGPLGPLKR